ncbi:hypothetical protein MKW92_007867 [Papaver armeniacum]|nr:hypothetical protein MKW92_007867 [Papaver armeniacum]
MGMQTDKVRFNVGGKIFETSATTLASARRSSMFGAMFDDEWNWLRELMQLFRNLQPSQVNEEYFIDRNPDCFSVLLDLLRTGELCVPPHVPDKLFYKEALYYGLLDHVRAARFRELDVNQLRLTISPDGVCAVAHSRIVRTYDWMLEEYPPINFNYQKVNDIGWIDSENIVISACERSGRQDSGIGLFSSSSGNLKHTFQLNQVKSFTAGALCFNSDGKIFAAFTGEQTDFFHKTLREPLCKANKIQCFNGSNCLLLFDLSEETRKKYISLLDFRDKSMVWYNTSVNEHKPFGPRINDNNLGFMDIRSTDGSIRWISNNRKNQVRPCYPKLTLHGGQLFSCLYDRISMFRGPDWFLTSSIERSCGGGGAIRDFSIGGDRLFALHSEENVFDVWEIPSPPSNWSL